MKIFAIKDESEKTLAWLIYYEPAGKFTIELPDNADPWETPLLLSSFLKRGEKTVNAYWSKLWVQQRIVPSDRQNLGQILKDNGLSEYDEFSLLMLAKGRCAQDDYYLEAVDADNLPQELVLRFEKKVDDVIPLSDHFLLVFFRNGTIRKFDCRKFMSDKRKFSPLLTNDELFKSVGVGAGGNEVNWGTLAEISASVLYKEGVKIPLSQDDFLSFVENRVVNSAEAEELLNCSRQNINDLVRRGKLHPIKTSPKNKLFLKSEIEQRCQ